MSFEKLVYVDFTGCQVRENIWKITLIAVNLREFFFVMRNAVNLQRMFLSCGKLAVNAKEFV